MIAPSRLPVAGLALLTALGVVLMHALPLQLNLSGSGAPVRAATAAPHVATGHDEGVAPAGRHDQHDPVDDGPSQHHVVAPCIAFMPATLPLPDGAPLASVLGEPLIHQPPGHATARVSAGSTRASPRPPNLHALCVMRT